MERVLDEERESNQYEEIGTEDEVKERRLQRKEKEKEGNKRFEKRRKFKKLR